MINWLIDVKAAAQPFFASAYLVNHDEAKNFPPWNTSATQDKCITILSLPYPQILYFPFNINIIVENNVSGALYTNILVKDGSAHRDG